jgi:hypothetical protein
VTFTAARGEGAGPPVFCPVAALYVDPWQGHINFSPPAGSTVHPMCVQIAVNATTLPAVGWETMIGLPFGVFAEIAVPTFTSDTLATTPPAGAESAGAAAEPLGAGLAVLAELPQAAKPTTPVITTTPVVITCRRDAPGVVGSWLIIISLNAVIPPTAPPGG